MSSRRERSRAAVEAVARALGEERGRVVFVGGTVAALYALEAVWGHFEGDAAGQTRAANVVAWLRGIDLQR